jgi:hypothetical protein
VQVGESLAKQLAQAIGTTEQGGEKLSAHKLGVWSRLELALYVASHGGAKWSEEFGMRQEAVLGTPAAADAQPASTQ